MSMTRRDFVRQAALASAAAPALAQVPAPVQAKAAVNPLPVRVGMTDWNLGQRGDITKIALAREIGLDGIQICTIAIGSPSRSRLPLHTNTAAAIL